LNGILIERSYPFLVFFLSYRFLKEKPTSKKVLGSILVIIGVVLMVTTGFLNEGTPSLKGDVIVFFSMFSFALWIIFAKRILKSSNEILVIMTSYVAGAIAMLFVTFSPQMLKGSLRLFCLSRDWGPP
jgi:drug/metabolite transporter (DMT)-like permease